MLTQAMDCSVVLKDIVSKLQMYIIQFVCTHLRN